MENMKQFIKIFNRIKRIAEHDEDYEVDIRDLSIVDIFYYKKYDELRINIGQVGKNFMFNSEYDKKIFEMTDEEFENWFSRYITMEE